MKAEFNADSVPVQAGVDKELKEELATVLRACTRVILHRHEDAPLLKRRNKTEYRGHVEFLKHWASNLSDEC